MNQWQFLIKKIIILSIDWIKMDKWIAIVWIWGLLNCVASLEMRDGAYDNLVIKIADNVPETDCRNILSNLEVSLTRNTRPIIHNYARHTANRFPSWCEVTHLIEPIN